MLPSMPLVAASPSCAFSFTALTLVTSVGALRAPIVTGARCTGGRPTMGTGWPGV